MNGLKDNFSGIKGTRNIVRMALLVILVAFAGMVVITIMALNKEESPLVFHSVYLTNENICGNTITYISTIEYTRAPVISESIRSVWNVDKNRTEVFDTNPRYTIITSPGTYNNTMKYILPEALEPGNYELRIAVTEKSSKMSVKRLQFTVPVDCK